MAEKNGPNLGLSYGWDLGEDGWKTGHDATIQKVDALLHLSVLSATTAAEPGAPTNGDRYVVPASGTSGDFIGNEEKVAVRVEGAWQYHTPKTGWVAWVEDDLHHLYYDGADWVNLQPYDIGITFAGAPTASEVLVRYPFPRAVVFPAGLTGSQGWAATAATAQADFDIQKNGASVGTMTFAASGNTASFTMASETSFAQGDVLTVVAPGTADSTLADLGVALVGTR